MEFLPAEAFYPPNGMHEKLPAGGLPPIEESIGRREDSLRYRIHKHKQSRWLKKYFDIKLVFPSNCKADVKNPIPYIPLLVRILISAAQPGLQPSAGADLAS